MHASAVGALLPAAIASLTVLRAASAQDAPALEEIVVTGQKISRSLAEAQSSVFALGASDIIDKELRNIRDTFRLAANVVDSDWVDSGFHIRGVNSEGLTPGGSPLATLYIDAAAQTVQGTRRGGRGLWDVERVEIYRGPQSTLSGRSSLAGAVHMFTRNPGFVWDSSVQVTAGTDAMQEAAFALGGPIVGDVLAFRVSGEYQSAENDINYPGYEQYSAFDDFITNEYHQLRGKVLYRPEAFDGAQVLATFSSAHDSPTLDDIAGPGLGFQYSERRGDLNAGTPFFQENRSADNDNLVLEISVPFADGWTLTSVTSQAETDMERPSINAGTPGEIYVALGGENQTYTTQELRLNQDRERWRWVAGLFFADEEAHGDRTLTNFFNGGRFDTSRFDSDVESRALLGEIEYDVSDRWTVVAGGRYHDEETRDETFFSRDYTDPGLTDVVNDSPAYTSSESRFLPKLGAIYHLANGHTLGLTYSEGFRSGGAGINGSTGSSYTYAPEGLENVELSYRAVFAGDRLSVGVNLYSGDWKDQQVEVQLDPNDFSSTQVENAAESSISGLEVELRGVLSQALTGFLSLGRAETEFESFDEGSIVDFSGLPFPQAPEWTASFGLDYARGNGFSFGFDVNYVDEFYARDYQNAPIDTVGDYTVLNFRAGYEADRWSVTVFANNAADEEYFVYRDVIGGFDCCATLGARQAVGVAGRWSWGP